MKEIIEFFTGLLDVSKWPPRWHCGEWSDLHGWLYIAGDLLIWSAYFAIPAVILHYVSKRGNLQFRKIYLSFFIFILACGLTHLLDAVSFWYPLYRLNALVLIITGIVSWGTVYLLVQILPKALSLKSLEELEAEIQHRKMAENTLRTSNLSLDAILAETSIEFRDYKFALDQSSIVAITDERGRITYVNENFCRISKFSQEELVGSDLLQRLSKDQQTSVIEDILQKINKGETWRGNLIHHSKDQEVYWTGTTIMPFAKQSDGIFRYFFIFSDITEMMKAEKIIYEKNKELENILERITDGFIALDKDMNYTYANKKIGEMVGKDPAYLMGKNVWNVFPEAVDSMTYKTFKKAYEEKKYLCSVDYYEPLDLWQENHIYPSSDGLFVFIRDITKQKRAEVKIRNSEKKFRHLIEHSEDIITLLDKNFNVVYRSASAEKITGYNNQERKTGNTLEQLHEEDREMYMSELKRVIATPHLSVNVSFRLFHKRGEYIWLEGTMTNMFHEKSIEAVVINFRDVTKKKEVENKLLESEKLYKMIASSIPGSVICILDRQLKYTLLEGDMLEKLGYQKENLINKKVDEIFPSEISKVWKEELQRAFEGEKFSKETRNNELDVLTRFVPLKNEENMVYSVMTVSLDISQLKTAQNEITELNRDLEMKIARRTEQLQAANRELESFSYSVSHDLRAPLRSINGYSKMLEEDYSALFDENGLRVLRTIQNNAKRMGLLIDDLLSFSRLGRLELKKAVLNMHELIASILPDILADGDYTTNIEVENLLPAYADLSMIKQVLINYLSNAIKYSSRKEYPKVIISSRATETEIIYSVEDNGTGFNMDYVHKLFNVFQRLHNSNDFEGTGVGLAIVKRIVEKHGGRVWAESKMDEGSIFYFSLPLKDDYSGY